MATARQVCRIIDETLRLPENTSRWAADRLRPAGLLPSTPGDPVDIDSGHAAHILLAVLVGTNGIRAYLDMRPISGGMTFGEVLAGFVQHPINLLELTLDASAPAAVVTYRGEDNGVRTDTFVGAAPHQRSEVSREVRLSASAMIHLAAAIRNAPPVRAGRRRISERFETRSYF